MEEIAEIVEIERYRVPLDRAYHPKDHTWARVEGDRVRIGMDALGQETVGDLAQILIAPAGTRLEAGDEIGSLEAQKFVGALRAPVCGTIVEVNERVLENPRLVNEDPYGEGWLVLLAPAGHLDEDLAALIRGEPVRAWFARELAEYRERGSVAE